MFMLFHVDRRIEGAGQRARGLSVSSMSRDRLILIWTEVCFVLVIIMSPPHLRPIHLHDYKRQNEEAVSKWGIRDNNHGGVMIFSRTQEGISWRT